ncbi:MAG: hypothetical protein ABI183_02080 [Polyangiaceae bacterium]
MKSAFAISLVGTFAAGLLACSIPASNDRYVQTSLPDQASFPPVAMMLELKCGSLDCHGSVARNLRIYGSAGLRFSPNDQPFATTSADGGNPFCNTSDEDYQDYVSVVGLEPEQISAVAAGGDPGTLTMVRKARGTEAHKGEQIWTQGDDSDVCLTSWLTGAAQASACARSLASALPNPTKNPLTQCISQ